MVKYEPPVVAAYAISALIFSAGVAVGIAAAKLLL